MAAFGVDHTALLYAGELWTAGDNIFGQLLRPEGAPGFQPTGLAATFVRTYDYQTYFATPDGVYRSGPLTRVVDGPVRDFLVLRHGHYVYLDERGDAYRRRDGAVTAYPYAGPGLTLRRGPTGVLVHGVDGRWRSADDGMLIAGGALLTDLVTFDGALYLLQEGDVLTARGAPLPFHVAWYDEAPGAVVALAANHRQLVALTTNYVLWEYDRARGGFVSLTTPPTAQFPGDMAADWPSTDTGAIIGLYAEGAGLAVQYEDESFALWGDDTLGQMGGSGLDAGGDDMGHDDTGHPNMGHPNTVAGTWARKTGRKGCGCG